MLVQRRKSSRKTIILWGGVIILVALAVLLVYQNISTEVTPAEESARTGIERLPVPKNLGTDVFGDPRFGALSNEDQALSYLDPYVTSYKVTARSIGAIPAPEHVTAVNPGYGGSVIISWSASKASDITGYTIWRRDAGGSKEYASVSSTKTSYVDENVVNGESYSYYITALRQVISEQSVNLNVESIGSGGVRITFTYPANVEAVQLFRKRGSEEELLATLKQGLDQYVDRDNVSSDEYFARAYTSYIESEQSAIVTATPDDVVAPDSPSDITVASSNDATSIIITWTNPLDDDLDFVRIHRSDTQGELGTIIKNTSNAMNFTGDVCSENTQIDTTLQNIPEGNCYLDKNIVPGETYYYVITSVDIHGNESSRKIVRTIGNSDPFSN